MIGKPERTSLFLFFPRVQVPKQSTHFQDVLIILRILDVLLVKLAQNMRVVVVPILDLADRTDFMPRVRPGKLHLACLLIHLPDYLKMISQPLLLVEFQLLAVHAQLESRSVVNPIKIELRVS